MRVQFRDVNGAAPFPEMELIVAPEVGAIMFVQDEGAYYEVVAHQWIFERAGPDRVKNLLIRVLLTGEIACPSAKPAPNSPAP